MSYFTKKLREKEVLIKIFKSHFIIFLFPFLIGGILALGSIFFSYYLFQKGTIGIILFSIIFLFGIFYLIRTLFIQYFNSLMITDQRIICINQKGFFDRSVKEIELKNIKDSSYRIKGILGTIFHFGNIYIQAGEVEGESLKIEFEKLKDPDKIQDLILTIKNNSKENVNKEEDEVLKESEGEKNLTAEEIINKTSTQEIFKMIKSFKDEIGEEKFKKIIDNSGLFKEDKKQ